MKKTILKNTLLLSALCVGVADSVCGSEFEYSASDGRTSAHGAVCWTAEDVDVSYEDDVKDVRLGLVWRGVFGPIMHAMNIAMESGGESIRQYLQKKCVGCDIVLGKIIDFEAQDFNGKWIEVMYFVNRNLHVALPGSLIPVSGGDKNVWCDNVLERVNPFVVDIIHEAHMWVLRRLGEVNDGKDVVPCVKSYDSIDKESAELYMQSALELLKECVRKATDYQAYEKDWEQRARNVLFARSKACMFGDALTGEGVLLCLSNIDELNGDYFRLTDIDDLKCAATLLVDGLPKDALAEKMIRSVQGGSETVDKEDENGGIIVDQKNGAPLEEELKYPPVETFEEAHKVLSYFCDFMCFTALCEGRCYINPYRVDLLMELFEDAVNGNDIVKNYKRQSGAKASMFEEVVKVFGAVQGFMRNEYDCSEPLSEEVSSAERSESSDDSSIHRSVSKNILTAVLSKKDVKLSAEGVKAYIKDLAQLFSNHFDVLHNTNAEKQLIADAKGILTTYALGLVFHDVNKRCDDMCAFYEGVERRSLEMRALEEDVESRSLDMCILSQLRNDVNRIKERIYPPGDKNVSIFYSSIPSMIKACEETQWNASNVIRIRQYIASGLIEEAVGKVVDGSVSGTYDPGVSRNILYKTYAPVISGKIVCTADGILSTLSGLNTDNEHVRTFKSKVADWKKFADTLSYDDSASGVNRLLELFDQIEIFRTGCHLCDLANRFMNAHSGLNDLCGAHQGVKRYKSAADDLHKKVLVSLSTFGNIKLDVRGNSDVDALARMKDCCDDVAGVLDEMQKLLNAVSGKSEPQPGIEQSGDQEEESVVSYRLKDLEQAQVESIVMANNDHANDHNWQTEIVATLAQEASDDKQEDTGKAQAKPGSETPSAISNKLKSSAALPNTGNMPLEAPAMTVQEIQVQPKKSVQKGIANWTKKKHMMVWGSVALTLICFMIAPFFIGGSSIAMIVFVAMGGTGSVFAILSSVFVK